MSLQSKFCLIVRLSAGPLIFGLAGCIQPRDPTGVWACNITYSGKQNPEQGKDIGMTRLIAMGAAVPVMSPGKDFRREGWIAISAPRRTDEIVRLTGVPRIVWDKQNWVFVASARRAARLGRDGGMPESKMEEIGYRENGRYFCFNDNEPLPLDQNLPQLPLLTKASGAACGLGFVAETSTFFIQPYLSSSLDSYARQQNPQGVSDETLAALPPSSEMGQCRRLQTSVTFPQKPLVTTVEGF